ncbi:MAG: hypothetical protein R3F54_19650 [Alphaproteobacteria bacterium]
MFFSFRGHSMRRSRLLTGMIVLINAAWATPMAAAELTIEPRLAAGVSYYDLDLDGAFVVGQDTVDNVQFNDWLYLVGGGLTISYDRVFVDLYGQYSFDGEDTVNADVVTGGVVASELGQKVTFDRVETALSLGYRVTDQLAAFVGYRYAEVNFDGKGSLGAVAAKFSTDFHQKGPFVGGSYVVPKPVLDGALVANAAVTYLDGELENKLDVSAPLQDVAFDTNGDALGFNGGVSWVRPLTDQLKLVLGADAAYYAFKDNDDVTDFDELIVRLRTELRYSFDLGAVGAN